MKKKKQQNTETRFNFKAVTLKKIFISFYLNSVEIVIFNEQIYKRPID